MKVLIHLTSHASYVILGLTNLARIQKTLDQLNCRDIKVIERGDDYLNYDLILSTDYHYDPDFIGWMIQNKIRNPLNCLDQVPRCWWQQLSDNFSFKGAEKKLFQNILEETQGWIAKSFNKKISFFLTQFLVKLPITPNQITSFNLVLSFLAASMMILPTYFYRVIGGLLICLSSILDGCDGEVARVKVMSSKFGAWFDTIADDLANNLFLAAIVLGLYWQTGNGIYLWFGFSALILSFGVSFFIYYQLITQKKSGNMEDFQVVWKKSDKKIWFDYLRPLMKRDFFIVVLFFFILINRREIVFWMGVVSITITFTLYMISSILFRGKSTKNSLESE